MTHLKICKSILLIIILFLFSFSSVAQKKGILKGNITDAQTGETLPGANIYVSNNKQLGTVSDLDGEYKLELPEGTYEITVSYISYENINIKNIHIISAQTLIHDFKLEEASLGLQTVEIVATRKTNSDISMINTIKTNIQVSSGISSQMISKTQDKDASEVVKRVSGVTVTDGKFVIIRGLNQRYNNMWLNNAIAPSSEADQRAFSFDMIPSNLIESLTVYKAATADIPADFSGGFIKIKTKSLPEENTNTVSYSVGVNQNTTFSDFKMNKGSSTDFLGFDNGRRAIPNLTPPNLNSSVINPEAMVQYSKKFNNDWDLKSKTAFPDQKIQFGISRKIKGKKLDVGTVNSLDYSYGFDKDVIQNKSYQVYDINSDKSSMNYDYNDKLYTETARLTLMSNWTFLPSTGDKISFKNLFNQIGRKGALDRYGWDYYGGNYKHITELSYMSRSIYTGQISGEHKINDNSFIEWMAGFAYANRNEPDIKRMTYLLDNDSISDTYGKYIAVITQNASVNSAGRLFTYLNEFAENASVDFTHTFRKQENTFRPQIKAGLFLERKDRKFETRLLGWRKSNYYKFDQSLLWKYDYTSEMFSQENINTETGFLIEETTSPSDSYKASNTLGATYAMVNLPYKGLNINAGLRFEYNAQIVEGYDQRSKPIITDKIKSDIFPSLNITYEFNPKHQIRFAYARNINRPEFRELAPYWFYSFEEAAGYTGNPHLKDAYIDNMELRYEYYPNSGQLITAGVFYKNFTNPIELKLSPTGSNMEYSFINAKGAYSIGAEIEIRKSLDFIKWMKNLNIVLNAAYIKTQVTYNQNDIQRPRPLQGQSPYIINAGLFYQSDKLGLSASLVYNIAGKRIIAIGEPKQNPNEDIPDIYEMPRNLLDLTISKKIGRYVELKFGANDLICNNVVTKQFVQFEKNGEKQTREQTNKKFNPGRRFSLGVSVTF